MEWPKPGDTLVLVDSVGSSDFRCEKVLPNQQYAAIETSNVWQKVFSLRDDNKLTARECFRNLFGVTVPKDWEYFVTPSQPHVVATTTNTFLSDQFIRMFWDES